MSCQTGRGVQALAWREGGRETLTWRAKSPFPAILLEVAGVELGYLHDVHIQILEHEDGPFSGNQTIAFFRNYGGFEGQLVPVEHNHSE